jgi:hypothetical protein
MVNVRKWRLGAIIPIDKRTPRANDGTFGVVSSVDTMSNLATMLVYEEEADATLVSAVALGEEAPPGHDERLTRASKTLKDLAPRAVTSSFSSHWKDAFMDEVVDEEDVEEVDPLIGKTFEVNNAIAYDAEDKPCTSYSGDAKVLHAHESLADMYVLSTPDDGLVLIVPKGMLLAGPSPEPRREAIAQCTIVGHDTYVSFNLIKALPISRKLADPTAAQSISRQELYDVAIAAGVKQLVDVDSDVFSAVAASYLAVLDSKLEARDGHQKEIWPKEDATRLGRRIAQWASSKHAAAPTPAPTAAAAVAAVAETPTPTFPRATAFKAKITDARAVWPVVVQYIADSQPTEANKNLVSTEEYVAMGATETFLKRAGINVKEIEALEPMGRSEAMFLLFNAQRDAIVTGSKPTDTPSKQPININVSSAQDLSGTTDDRRIRTALRSDAQAVASDKKTRRRLEDMALMTDAADSVELQSMVEEEESDALHRLVNTTRDLDNVLNGKPFHTPNPRARHTRAERPEAWPPPARQPKPFRPEARSGTQLNALGHQEPRAPYGLTLQEHAFGPQRGKLTRARLRAS